MTTLLTPRSPTGFNTPIGREWRPLADPATHTPPTSRNRDVTTHSHAHRADRPQTIVHSDDSPHRCHSLIRDKIPNRNTRARISSNPGLCRGFARHESFSR
jgi:hypothetical protein